MVKLRWIKNWKERKPGDISNAAKNSAENFISQGYAEYIEEPKLSKKTTAKLIHKEAEKFREKNPKLKKSIEKVRDQRKMNVEIPKLDSEAVGNYIKTWATMKKTPQLISSMKQVSKNSEFSMQHLKEMLSDEKKEIEEQQKENKEQEEPKKKPESFKEEIFTLLLLKKYDEANELIVEEIKRNNHIYTVKDDVKPEIWIYKEGVYVPQGKCEIEKQVRKLLGQAFKISLSNEILHKIKADTQIDIDEFFKTNYIDEVPVKNGILNIFTRELSFFDPKKIFFNKLPIIYNPEAKCPIIIKFLEDVLKSKDDVPVMLELFGFAMLKEYRFEKAFMFVGSGRNGKSKTIELLKHLLGIENCCSVPLSQITAENTSVEQLHGKMVNLAGDLSNDSLKKTGMFKQTVGRDLISAKRKYLRDLPFINYAKHIFATNELPKVYDLSDGFWTKWVLLEFPYKFITQKEFDSLPKEEREMKKILDTDIIQKITTEEEMSGLLNTALDNLNNLIDNKDFSYSKGTADIKDFWIRQSDSFAAFCIDKIIGDYNNHISKKNLRKEFNFYCKRNKLKGSSDKGIKASLEDRYGAVESQIRVGEDRERVWEGIRFKDE